MFQSLPHYYRILGIRGLISAGAAKLSRKQRLISMSVPGSNQPVYLRVPSTDLFTYEQIFQEREYEFEARRAPEVIIDAGANIGLSAVYFALRFPSARIVAIEPQRGNFEMLLRNVAHYPNVTPLMAALWDRDTTVSIEDPGLGEWGFTTSEQRQGPESVRAVTVDGVMSEFGLNTVDVLKIDIEGAEFEVFRDTSRWISRVNCIIVELHERKRAGANRRFYNGSNGFDCEWSKGENVYVSRAAFMARPGSPISE